MAIAAHSWWGMRLGTGLLAAMVWLAAIAEPRTGLAQGGIVQSTYLGGRGATDGRAVAVDEATGDVLIVGSATDDDVPGTAGGVQPELAGLQDGWVARLSADLRTVRHATYLGGTALDQVDALVVDPDSGDVLIAGYTASRDLPGTAGSAQPVLAGPSDAFVARLSADLRTLHQASYLGGTRDEGGPTLGLAIDRRTGDILVAGATRSADFPGTPGSAQPRCGGAASACADGFVARLSGDLTAVMRTTYTGGSGEDEAYDVAVHPRTSDVLVTGLFGSGPTGRIGFVDCYNRQLTTLRGRARLGTRAQGLAIDGPSGDVIAAGETGNSLNAAGGAQQQYGGGASDAFVARFNLDLIPLQATYVGGSGDDGGAVTVAIRPDTGEVVVAGTTRSADLPGTSGSAQSSPGGAEDAFAALLSSDLSLLARATYLGGSGDDRGLRVAVAPEAAAVIVTGQTNSVDFPATAGGAQPELPTPSVDGASAAFAARIDVELLAGPPTPTATPTQPSGCMGDCAGDSQVTVDDLIKGVNIALDNLAVAACTAFDVDGNSRVTVDELVGGVNSALNGCG